MENTLKKQYLVHFNEISLGNIDFSPKLFGNFAKRFEL